MHWVDVLNEAVGWRQHDGGPGPMQAEIGLLRRVFACRYLDVALDREDATALAQWLAAVTLHVEPDGAGRLHLAARRGTEALAGRSEALLSAALVQLLAEADGSFAVVHRCHGIVRDSAAPWGSRDLEVRFAERARLAALVDGSSLHQCPRLVRGERGARFCSKACSNASFAARKTRSEPRYFAAKQERYRGRRQRGEAARIDRGAFVYID